MNRAGHTTMDRDLAKIFAAGLPLPAASAKLEDAFAGAGSDWLYLYGAGNIPDAKLVQSRKGTGPCKSEVKVFFSNQWTGNANWGDGHSELSWFYGRPAGSGVYIRGVFVRITVWYSHVTWACDEPQVAPDTGVASEIRELVSRGVKPRDALARVHKRALNSSPDAVRQWRDLERQAIEAASLSAKIARVGIGLKSTARRSVAALAGLLARAVETARAAERPASVAERAAESPAPAAQRGGDEASSGCAAERETTYLMPFEDAEECSRTTAFLVPFEGDSVVGDSAAEDTAEDAATAPRDGSFLLAM